MSTTAEQPEMAERTDAKRQKVTADDDEFEFNIAVQHLKSFRQMIDVVGSVLRQIYMTVTPHTGIGKGVLLSIDTIDPNHVCMVQSRLVCDGTVTQPTSFCVDTETLVHCLKNIPRHHQLQISQKKKSAEVVMRSVDGMSKVVDVEFCLSTFDQEPETMNLEELEYEFVNQADMPSLKNTIRLAKDLNCDLLRLSMHVDKTATGKGNVEAMLAVSGDGGNAKFKRFMTSAVQVDDSKSGSTMKTVDASERANLSEVHMSEYSLDYMTKITKNMEDQTLTIKMGKDLPLLIHYGLGVEDSYVRFVIAPRQDDE